MQDRAKERHVEHRQKPFRKSERDDRYREKKLPIGERPYILAKKGKTVGTTVRSREVIPFLKRDDEPASLALARPSCFERAPTLLTKKSAKGPGLTVGRGGGNSHPSREDRKTTQGTGSKAHI